MDGRSCAVKVPWTAEEDDLIRSEQFTIDELCQKIPAHTKAAIVNRRSQLKPKNVRRKRRTWTKDEIVIISDMSISNKRAAEQIGVKPFDIQQARYARFGWAPKQNIFENVDETQQKILLNPIYNNTQAAKLCSMSTSRVKKYREKFAPDVEFKKY